MNLLNSIKNVVLGPEDPTPKIAEILPISDSEFSCNYTECSNTYKESCFSLKDKDAKVPLYETSQPTDLHFLVSTGKTDWEHDAFDGTYAILNKISQNAQRISSSCGINVKSNVTNESLNILDVDCLSLNKLDLLLLPWFVRIKGITNENLAPIFEVIEEIVTDSKSKDEVKGLEGKILMEKLKPIDSVTVSLDSNQSYVLLCSHRTRDKRCGITAPIMKKEFDSQLSDLNLFRDSSDDRPDGVKVLFVNHVGGHKFSANVLIYNKHGEFVWYARCNPTNVKFIINETILNHKVSVPSIRACSKFESIKW